VHAAVPLAVVGLAASTSGAAEAGALGTVRITGIRAAAAAGGLINEYIQAA
jgi:hypothetical protein